LEPVRAGSVNAVVALDAAGCITHFNPAAERTFGYRADDLLGDSFLRLLPERWHTPYRLQIDRLFSDEDAANAGRTIELSGLRRDGSEFPLELCLVTWRIDERSLYTVLVRDITQLREIEAEREALLARVEAMARTDPLTGLANRRALDEELRRELARAARMDYPVCMALLDLDHFKDFNDGRGHQAGDALLREAATTWRMLLRVTDFIARWGGDEFLVVLPDCPRSEAVAVVERLRAATPLEQTCCAGMAFWHGGMTAEQLIAGADAALYRAKRAGRDRNIAN
jgi:diguanylate cyclase (GGDEF)-like protein/PAS domain S-box-containing protein